MNKQRLSCNFEAEELEAESEAAGWLQEHKHCRLLGAGWKIASYKARRLVRTSSLDGIMEDGKRMPIYLLIATM
jgi:hypothetical protein